MKKLALAILIIATHILAMGQYLEIGPVAGVSYYIGDINPSKHFSGVSPAFGLVARMNYTSRWTLKGAINIGKIKASDADYQAFYGRNLSFESTLTEISAQVELNFLPYFTGSSKEFFTPYIFAGLSGFIFNPKALYNGSWVELQPLNTEGQDTKAYPDRSPYATAGIAFPFGLGMKLSLGKRWCIGLEWGLRKTFTDYLDDVSTTYYLQGEDINPQVAEEYLSDPTMSHTPGMQRGNSQNNDWYSFAVGFLTYRFSLQKEPRCNDFKNVQKFR